MATSDKKKKSVPVKKLPKVIEDDEERLRKIKHKKVVDRTKSRSTVKRGVKPKYRTQEERISVAKKQRADWYKKMVSDKYTCKCGKKVSRCRKDNHVLTFFHLKAVKTNVMELSKKQMREILLKKLEIPTSRK